jgi:hypothetical protein
MPGKDLRSVPGLQENYQRALTNKLGINSIQALVEADQRSVYAALGNTRPRPSLKRIAAWQEDARSRLSDDAVERSAWNTAASFALIFSQRQVEGTWERRLQAEQTEVEPASDPQQWPSWDCRPLRDWMMGKLGVPEDKADPQASAFDQDVAAEPATSALRSDAQRAELRIDSAVIIDAVRELVLIRAGSPIAAPPEDLRPPVRLNLAVSGGRSGQQLRAAVWFRRRAEPGWSPQNPVTVPSFGHAEFDLSSVPPGDHDVRLLAWATEAGATLAAVSLPKLRFRHSPEWEEGGG